MLAVLAPSDSFSAVWPTLSSSRELPLHRTADIEEVERMETVSAIVIAVGGIEPTAPALVRQLHRKGGPEIAVVGAEPCHRLCAILLQEGASDYFSLPSDLEELRSWVGDRTTAAAQGKVGQRGTRGRTGPLFTRIVGRSPALQVTLRRAAKITGSATTTALITGETGTGKQLLAEAIHENGPRAGGPFIDINCAALPTSLLETELFGYEKGSFTDAKTEKAGLFEAAEGGTLFLDEIGDFPLEVQGKLLKVLDSKRVRRVGGVRTIPVDVRLLAGTHADLEQRVREGRFRKDLYYRLNVIPLSLPPLRARGRDVLLLADHFLNAFAAEHDLPQPTLNAEIREALLAYYWPGNVRELRNSIERSLLLGDGRIDPNDLLLESCMTGPDSGATVRNGNGRGLSRLSFPNSMEEIQRHAARTTVAECGGNKSRAAQILQISRKRLYTLLNGNPN